MEAQARLCTRTYPHTPAHACTNTGPRSPAHTQMWPVDTHASHAHLHEQTYMHTHAQICTHMHALRHTYSHIHTHILTHTHMLMHTHCSHTNTMHAPTPHIRTYSTLTHGHMHTTYTGTRTLRMHTVTYTDQPRPPHSRSHPRPCRTHVAVHAQRYSHPHILRAAVEPFIH